MAVQEELSPELLPMAEGEVSYVKEQGNGYSVEKDSLSTDMETQIATSLS